MMGDQGQPGDQVADTDGLAAEAMDRRMYGHSFTLNGERVDPLCVSVDAAGALTAGTAPFRHAVTPGARSDASVAADKARIAQLEAENAELGVRLEDQTRATFRWLGKWLAATAQPQPLSAGWHHLPDVTAPDRGFPARALRFSKP